MRFLTGHSDYPERASKYIKVLETKKHMIDIQEIYDPHMLDIFIWRKDSQNEFFILKTIKHIPLNLKTFKMINNDDINYGKIRLQMLLDNIKRRK